jgi:hypothetical protein
LIPVEFIHATLNGQEEVRAGLYMDDENKNGCVAVCEAGGMCYMGSLLEGKNESQQVFIALKNKKTNKVCCLWCLQCVL